jgi:hypothetical protein
VDGRCCEYGYRYGYGDLEIDAWGGPKISHAVIDEQAEMMTRIQGGWVQYTRYNSSLTSTSPLQISRALQRHRPGRREGTIPPVTGKRDGVLGVQVSQAKPSW